MYSQLCRNSRSRSRSGFTLVELLMVIVIIGALAALGLAAVMRARGSANRFAIQTNINEFAEALEQFKTENGFYPPDFTRIPNANVFLPFLNRVAPNHAELGQAQGFAVGVRRIDVWWDQVGQYLGPESALTFWLSGLAKNQQFPLTYTANNGTPANTADDFVVALPPYELELLPQRVAAATAADLATVERKIYFKFPITTLIRVFQATDARVPAPASFPIWDVDAPAFQMAGYNSGVVQRNGETDTPVLYWELASYRPGIDVVPSRLIQVGTGTGTAYPYANASGVYFNSDKFQLVAPGLDGIHFLGATSNTIVGNIDKIEKDNVTNFCDGSLESFLLK